MPSREVTTARTTTVVVNDEERAASSVLAAIFLFPAYSYGTVKPSIPYHELIKQEQAAEKEIKGKEETSKEQKVPAKEQKKPSQKRASFYREHIRFPFIRQHDELTCGTTCLMMIGKYYGKNFASNRLRELAHVDLSGVSLANMASDAEQLGFTTRARKLDYDTLMSALQPCIVHWQGNHYIVVFRINAKHVWVADPALGLRKYNRKHFTDNWNGITLIWNS